MHSDIEGPAGAPDLVLLHGGIGTGRFHWGRPARTLAEHFRVHLPDLPGHGRTPLPADREYGRDVLAEAVAAYLERVGPPVHVGAFSMGAHTCLALLEDRQDLFASLVLVGCSIRNHGGLDEWRARFDPARFPEEFPMWSRHLARIHEPLGGPDAWLDVLRRDSGGTGVDVDIDRIGTFRRPVLLVRGDRDSTIDPTQYLELRERWRHADEFVVPAGGHDVHLTRHQLVTPALVDFYRRNDIAGDGG